MRRLDCLPCSGGAMQYNGQTLHWLIQSHAAHPALSLGRPPLGLLHPTEETRLAEMTNPQRRHSWLLGRWTAKHLLQSMFQYTTGVRLPLNQLVIHNDRTGAPYVMLPESETRLLGENGFLTPREGLSLSISHAGPYAFCAASHAGAGIRRPSLADQAASPYYSVFVGADIEHVEARGSSFTADFLSPQELARVRQTPPDCHATLITALWCAKEAALKAGGRGLTLDTRRLTCHLDWPDLEPLDGWRTFHITTTEHNPTPLAWSGWWRVLDGYVLTLAISSPP